MKFTFGKYKGAYLNEVTDRNYLQWVLLNVQELEEEDRNAITDRIVNLTPLSTKKGEKLDPDKILVLNTILLAEITEWEREFTNSVLRYGHMTEKQKEVVLKILKKTSRMIA